MKLRYFILLCCIVLVIFLVPLFLWRRNTAVVSPIPSTPVPSVSSTIWLSHQGEYFSFQYPSSVVVYDKENQSVLDNKAIVEFWRFNQLHPNLQFVAQAMHQPELLTLDEFSSVASRRNKQDTYSETDIQVDGILGVKFVKHGILGGDPSEYVAFLMHRGTVYTFAVTARDENQGKEMFERIISSVVLTDH